MIKPYAILFAARQETDRISVDQLDVLHVQCDA